MTRWLQRKFEWKSLAQDGKRQKVFLVTKIDKRERLPQRKQLEQSL
jgi:hypothetical protein